MKGIFLLAVALLGVGTINAQFLGEIGGKGFYLHTESVTFSTASDTCEGQGQVLAELLTREENNFLMNNLLLQGRVGAHWVGGYISGAPQHSKWHYSQEAINSSIPYEMSWSSPVYGLAVASLARVWTLGTVYGYMEDPFGFGNKPFVCQQVNSTNSSVTRPRAVSVLKPEKKQDDINLRQSLNLTFLGTVGQKEFHAALSARENWTHSLTLCEMEGMQLGEIRTQEENDFLGSSSFISQYDTLWTAGRLISTAEDVQWWSSDEEVHIEFGQMDTSVQYHRYSLGFQIGFNFNSRWWYVKETEKYAYLCQKNV